MSGRIARRGLVFAVGIALVAAGVTVAAILATAAPGSTAFPRLVPGPAPQGWLQASLPNGTAVLSYPPYLRPIAGDRDAVSVAQRTAAGAFVLYLNATPRQGAETLRNWASFRLSLLRSDSASSAHQDSAAQGVTFRGGTGSCVIDDYVTRIGHHHYKEIACLAQGRTSGSVIVAAAPARQWAQAHVVLEQAVTAYVVR